MLYHFILRSQETNDTARSREHQRGIHGGQRNRNEKMSSENTRGENFEVIRNLTDILTESTVTRNNQMLTSIKFSLPDLHILYIHYTLMLTNIHVG